MSNRTPQKRQPVKKKKRLSKKKVFTALIITAALAIVVGLAGYVFILYSGQKQLKENENKFVMAQASTIYDVEGNEVAKLYNGENNRIIAKYEEFPDLLVDAFVATEDKRFWDHSGVDPQSIARAIVKDVVQRRAVEGGSTITQQLAKNMFLNADKTFFRKATEMSMAMALEQQFTKKEIMEKYLNQIFFGNSSWGVKTAAKTYFGVTDLKKLELWQMATLAAMPKAPSYYNPIKHPDKSMERREVVLTLMYNQGYITKDQMEQAAKVKYVKPAKSAQTGSTAAFDSFKDYVVQEAEDKYGIDEDKLARGGYQIKTTLVQSAQKAMDTAYKDDSLFQEDMNGEMMQSSMVILDNATGGIVAMTGGRDYQSKMTFNRAVNMTRSPGSSIKPVLVYAPALESGKYTPYSQLNDTRTDFNGYSPRNADGKYEGKVTLQYAVKKSKNVPAVSVLQDIGVKTGKAFAEKLGLSFDPSDNNLALALGGMAHGVSPLQMAQAYTSFPTGGTLHEAHAITEIQGADGDTVASFKTKAKQVMSAETAWNMTQILETVVQSGGTGAKAAMNRPLAGKTGSSQLTVKGLEKYNTDLWFVGYTPEWTGAVWMGFDTTDKSHYITMSSGSAGVIFKTVMEKALAGHPVKDFERPAGIQDAATPPAGVTNLTAVFDPETAHVKLTWTAPSDASKLTFRLYRKEASEDAATVLQELSGVSEFEDMTVVAGGNYQYYVTTYDPEGGEEGTPSNTAVIAIPADAGLTPSPSVSPSETPSATPDEGETPSDSATPSPGDTGAEPTPPPGETESPTVTPSPDEGNPTPTSTPASGNEEGGADGVGAVLGGNGNGLHNGNGRGNGNGNGGRNP
ncbi:PBP1A family penicillin-binding protein [Gorillibacterium sp. sgz500922]|uniref:transglycosylase domain-containing protein n=1 Tax=Gorillibacterium sp. sgz500922 TaxID=3446694 RepID=UPI003F6647B0